MWLVHYWHGLSLEDDESSGFTGTLKDMAYSGERDGIFSIKFELKPYLPQIFQHAPQFQAIRNLLKRLGLKSALRRLLIFTQCPIVAVLLNEVLCTSSTP